MLKSFWGVKLSCFQTPFNWGVNIVAKQYSPYLVAISWMLPKNSISYHFGQNSGFSHNGRLDLFESRVQHTRGDDTEQMYLDGWAIFFAQMPQCTRGLGCACVQGACSCTAWSYPDEWVQTGIIVSTLPSRWSPLKTWLKQSRALKLKINPRLS